MFHSIGNVLRIGYGGIKTMTEKHFFKIVNDYYISYDGDIFDLHKPSDIRSLCYIMNRLQGFTELECEYNGEYKE